MAGQSKSLNAIIFTFTLLITALSPAISATQTAWSGPSIVDPTSQGGNITISGFSIPESDEVTDAWVEVSEDGMTDLGLARKWVAGAPFQENFSWGLWNSTTADFFDGSLSLDANNSVGRVNDFETLTRTLQNWGFGGTQGVWEVDDMLGIPGSINGSGRESSGGLIPIGSVNGRYIVATIADQSLPNGVHSWLESPDFFIPAVINDFNLTFSHWQHMYTPSLGNGNADGAWVEASLDGGQSWNYISPEGGYNNQINPSAPSPNGSGGGNFPVWASPNATGWQQANFNLDSLNGIASASNIRFRFVVWTDSNSTVQRPGWFLDNVNLTNTGADLGAWFHGNLTNYYADGADSFLTFEVNLINASGPIMLEYAADFDLEGDIYDNFIWQWSTSNFSWNSFSAPMPGNGVLINGQMYIDDSRGWKQLSHPLPQSLAGNSTVYIRLAIETDSFPGSGFGGLTLDPPEGLFVDDVVIYSGLQGAQTEHLALNFTTPNNGNVSHAAIGNAVDEWQHLTTHGVKGPSFQLDSFEDSPLLPDGWAIDTVRGAGWEFRAHNSTWPYGPDAPDSGVSYAGIEFSQKYQPNTWTHLISPSLAIPFGSHARISFKQFICAELGWDGGVVFLSEDDGRTWIPYGTNEPDFYDSHQNMNPQSDIYNLWAMDGSNAKPTCDGQRGSGNVNKSWVTKEADVSQYGGKSIRLKFSFFTDPLVESDGWYLDDVGIYVDWFEEYGTWLSDPIYPADLLGMDSIEIDADIPNGTWVKATVLGTFNDGSPDSKWTNMSLPASLLGLEGDSIVNDSNPIRIRLEMGTTEEQLTPKVHALYLGATRILNSRNLNGSFWYLDPSLQVNLTTSNITNSGITPLSLYQQIMVTPTHPLTAFEISGTGAGVYITILDEKQNPIYSGMMSNNTVQPTSPASQYRVELSIQPGGWLQHLKVDGRRASPAVGAMIDVGNNGIGDWQWPGYSAWGGLGWQTQGCFNPDPHLNCNPMWDVSDSGMYAYPPLINGTSSRHSSVDIQSDMTLNYSFRLPTDATPLGAKILFELESLNGDLNLSTNATLKLAGSPLWSLRGNSTSWWGSFTPYTLNLFAQHDFQSLSNQTLRNWTTYSLEIETAGGTPDYPLRISATILSVEYSLTENISGLGPLVNTLTDSLTPTNSTLPIPVSVGTWQGGLDLWGGIEHAPIMESEVVVVNSPWVPDRTSTITTEHTHLYSPNQLERLSLTIQSQAIPAMKFDVTNMSGNPQFAQNVTSNHLQINSNLSTVTPIENGFRVDWVLQTAWHWDDIDNLEIIAETFDLDQHHLNPDIMIAGSGSNAIENDMEIDFWQVRGSDGRELSAVNSPSYPFEIAAGSIVEASGTIRFQDTIFRPSEANYQVAIQIETESGTTQVLATSGNNGEWNASIPIPAYHGEVNLTSWVLRPGPAGVLLTGAEDATPHHNPFMLIVDPNAPQLGELMVYTPSGARPANGNVWPEDRLLPLSVEVTDSEALGGVISLHYWREGIDDFNQDGIADENEYFIRREGTPLKMIGTYRVDFPSIDLVANGVDGKVSLFIRGTDLAGHEVIGGGGPGLDNDMATLVTQPDSPTHISLPSIEMNRHGNNLLAGVEHEFSFSLIDDNGIQSLDNITVALTNGYSRGEMWINPMSEEVSVADNSPIHPTSLTITELAAGSFKVNLKFRIGVNAPIFWNHTVQTPAIIITESGQQLELGSSAITPLQWYLDGRIKLELESVEDLVSPISHQLDSTINIQSDDRVELRAVMKHIATDQNITLDGNWQANISFIGIDHSQFRHENFTDKKWISITQIMEQSQWPEGEVMVTATVFGDNSIEEIISMQLTIVLDDTSPSVEFPDSTLSIVNSNQMTQQLVTVRVVELGGMGEEPLELHWSFRRHGVEVLGLSGVSDLSLAAASDGLWTYSSRVDFDVDASLLKSGDTLVVWVEGYDLAGHSIVGKGSENDARMPQLRVIYFKPGITDITVNPYEPLLESIFTIDGRLVNDGNDKGTVEVSLITWREGGGGGSFVVLNKTNVTLLPQQQAIFSFEVEAWSTGDLQLYLTLDNDESNLTVVPVGLVRDQSAGEALFATLNSPQAIGLFILLLAVAAMIGFTFSRKENDDDEWGEFDDEILDSESELNGSGSIPKSEDEILDSESELNGPGSIRKIDGKGKPPPPPFAPDAWPDGAGPPPEILTMERQYEEE